MFALFVFAVCELCGLRSGLFLFAGCLLLFWFDCLICLNFLFVCDC